MIVLGTVFGSFITTEKNTAMITLQLGNRYRSKEGHILEVIETTLDKTFEFRAKDLDTGEFRLYTKRGKFWKTRPSNKDLIEKVLNS